MVKDICLILGTASPPIARHINAPTTKGPVALSPFPKTNIPIAKIPKIAEQPSKGVYIFFMVAQYVYFYKL
jgi:hypothetical protein